MSPVAAHAVPAPGEPTPAALGNPLLRYLLAARPAFLSITLVGCILGLAVAPAFDPALAGLCVALALLAHAGVNVFNDYYDHLNGTDAANTRRIFPFTGGSRFIQNGVLTPRQTLAYALALFAAVIIGGLWLMTRVGAGLFGVGLAGLLIGWAYSAPPLRLNSRGLGEACVAVGFLLIVAGCDFVLRGAFAARPWLAGLPYALLVVNVLYINQFPDRDADLLAGKRHWVARLAPETAARGYGLILAASVLALGLGAGLGTLPPLALLAALAYVPAWRAARMLRRNARQPERLAPAIRLTLLAAHAQPVLLAAILFWSAS